MITKKETANVLDQAMAQYDTKLWERLVGNLSVGQRVQQNIVL
jgi:hypothetical protein